MKRNETIQIKDNDGLIHEVYVKHTPLLGLSTAYHKGSVLEVVESYRLSEPFTSNDLEWEKYKEKCSEWRDNIMYLVKMRCMAHFIKAKG